MIRFWFRQESRKRRVPDCELLYSERKRSEIPVDVVD